MVNKTKPILHLTNSQECTQLRTTVINQNIPVVIDYEANKVTSSYNIPYIEYKDSIVQDFYGVMFVLMQLYEKRSPDKIFDVDPTGNKKKTTKLEMNIEGKLKLALMYVFGAGLTILIYRYTPNINSILLTILLGIPLALILFPALFGKIKNLLENIGTNMNKDIN